MAANPQAEQILGRSIGPSDYEEFVELFGLAPRAKDSSRFEASLPRRSVVEVDGKWIGYSVHTIGDGYHCVLFQDITERKRLEAVAESMNLAENIGFVFSALRHELGNPLTAIKMGLIVLANRIGDYDEEQIRQHINILLEDVARIESVLRSMKSYGMRDEVVVAEMDLAAEVKHFVDRLRPGMAAAGITVNYEGPDELIVLGDPRALDHVLLNLVSNATAALTGRPSPAINFRLQTSGRVTARLMVEDNGAGMSEANKSMVFRPFFTTKRDGSGLGLVICQKLLAKMGGTIELESEQDVGTTVTLSLPILRGEENR